MEKTTSAGQGEAGKAECAPATLSLPHHHNSVAPCEPITTHGWVEAHRWVQWGAYRPCYAQWSGVWEPIAHPRQMSEAERGVGSLSLGPSKCRTREGGGLTYVEQAGFETGDRVRKQWPTTFLPGGHGSCPGMVDGSLVREQCLITGWQSAAGWVGLHGGGLQGGQPCFQCGYLDGLLLHLSCHVVWGNVGRPTGRICRGHMLRRGGHVWSTAAVQLGLLGWNECILGGGRGLGARVGRRLSSGILGGVVRPACGWHHAWVAGDGGKVEAQVSVGHVSNR